MGHIATWLELAMSSARPDGASTVRVHDVSCGKRHSCFAVSIDDRWLHAGSGQLTVFHGLTTAMRFLKLAGVARFEPGAPGHGEVRCGASLCLEAGRQLGSCPHAVQRQEGGCGRA